MQPRTRWFRRHICKDEARAGLPCWSAVLVCRAGLPCCCGFLCSCGVCRAGLPCSSAVLVCRGAVVCYALRSAVLIRHAGPPCCCGLLCFCGLPCWPVVLVCRAGLPCWSAVLVCRAGLPCWCAVLVCPRANAGTPRHTCAAYQQQSILHKPSGQKRRFPFLSGQVFSPTNNEVEEGRRITMLRMSRAKRGFFPERAWAQGSLLVGFPPVLT